MGSPNMRCVVDLLVAGTCLPPASSEGGCAATDVSEYSDNQKEHFAMSCKVAWPCRDCKTDFDGCPSGWGTVGKLCVAPPTYDGICSPVSDFSDASAAAKATWSTMCGARWPCGGV